VCVGANGSLCRSSLRAVCAAVFRSALGCVWQCLGSVPQCGSVRCGRVRQFTRLCAAVMRTALCGSVWQCTHDSVRAVREVHAVVCGSVRQCACVGSVWQCGSACIAVRQCAAVCAAAVCGNARGSVWQCVAVCGSARGSVWQQVTHNSIIICPIDVYNMTNSYNNAYQYLRLSLRLSPRGAPLQCIMFPHK
jgi:hypothetical protein